MTIEYEDFMGIRDSYPDDMLFYHYCSPDTFLSICNGKKLRFSDLFCMNDHMENYWGYEIWIEAVNELLDNKEIEEKFIDEIDKIINEASLGFLKLACCLSRDGDVLSQWRAYANDASGYSIGFLANELRKMPIRIIPVCYDKNQQKDIVKSFVRAIYEVEKDNKTEDKEDFQRTCKEFAVSLSSFKNPAFKEELEIRLMHIAVLDLSDIDNPEYKFGGGMANGAECRDYQLHYRMNKSVPTAFMDIDFYYDNNPIKEVILGPKNESLLSGVFMAMNSLGLKNVKVKKSEASYR
ncbi:DUF2971 domain-containing protein [Acinetobacter modestus]|uniref:DUF2971 domain-containing protein n=1 Tax=Acinetobacter modestus TaxID=1776740 RepID=A0ABN0JM80_9GAMM|nr:DUF2971 domain-containing protein [Acinetobacter modestus]ENU26406.1 hypothetical protein F992_01954 [Acinetobacter modestus]GGA08642.1 hypothetical protein GCM10017554_00330 [Acinetobacter modestus]